MTFSSALRGGVMALAMAAPMLAATITVDVGQVQARFAGAAFGNSATFTTAGGGQISFVGADPTAQTGLSSGDPFAVSNFGNLAITVSSTVVETINTTFDLLVPFTLPGGVSPNPVTYTATVNGKLNPGGSADAVFITFASPTQSFSFSDSGTTGSFTLTLQQPFAANGATPAQLDGGGFVTAAASAVPEPGTYAMLATGIGAIVVARRRRSA